MPKSVATILGIALTALTLGCSDSTTPTAPTSSPPPPPVSTTPPPPPPPTMPTGPTTLRRATFESANGYTTMGTARIERNASEHSLELDSDFRTSNSPALDVRLCKNAQCTGEHRSLGTLQRFAGPQSYPLDDDGTEFSFVSIYCAAVRLPFGYGRLR